MSFISDVESLGVKIEDFLKVVVNGANTLQKTWGTLSGPTLAAVAAIFHDVITTVSTAESVAADASTGNVLGAITLSETTIGLVKQLVADAKAGEKQIVADFDALGLKS